MTRTSALQECRELAVLNLLDHMTQQKDCAKLLSQNYLKKCPVLQTKNDINLNTVLEKLSFETSHTQYKY